MINHFFFFLNGYHCRLLSSKSTTDLKKNYYIFVKIYCVINKLKIRIHSLSQLRDQTEPFRSCACFILAADHPFSSIIGVQYQSYIANICTHEIYQSPFITVTETEIKIAKKNRNYQINLVKLPRRMVELSFGTYSELYSSLLHSNVKMFVVCNRIRCI